MFQGVSVGFFSATSPVIATAGNGTAAAPAESGDASLFATLLALLGVQPEAQMPSLPAPTEAAPSSSAGLPPPAAPLIDLAELPEALPNLRASDQGRALLKDLGKALLAVSDALESGEPIPPALEKKLEDSLDAVAVYLGGTPTPPQPVDPAISALASGEAVLPVEAPALPPAPIPETPAPSTDPELPVMEPASQSAEAEPHVDEPGFQPTADSPEITIAAASKIELRLTASETEAPKDSPASVIPAAPEAKSVASLSESDAVATPADAAATDGEPTGETPLPEPLRKLRQILTTLAPKLEARAPELAHRLEALAAQLSAATIPADALEALGLTTDDAADPEIAKILDVLADAKPSNKPANPAPQPFVVPSLEPPEQLGAERKNLDPQTAAEIANPEGKAGDSDTEIIEAATKLDSAARLVADKDKRPDEAAKPAPVAQIAARAPDAATNPPDPASQSTPPQPPATTGTRTIHAAYQAPLLQLNLPQMAFEMVRQFEAGNSRFQIRLDPPELGRIDVKLDVDKSGTVNARMTVERPETLDLMQRDQRALQQALQQAGLDSSKTNLEFSLRQNPFTPHGGFGDGRDGQQPGFGSPGGTTGSDELADAAPVSTLYRGTASAGGVNLFV